MTLKTRRVVYYSPHDLAAGQHRDRTMELIDVCDDQDAANINDAIESHQCALLIKNCPWLFDESESELEAAHKKLNAKACRTANLLLQKKSIQNIYEETELQYAHRLWLLVATSGAWRQISADSLQKLLCNEPSLLADMLDNGILAKEFKAVIRLAMLSNPNESAEIIISRLASNNRKQEQITLPRSLTNEDIDQIMSDYLDGESPNLNYVQALASWPTSAKSQYSPSPDVLVKAKRTAQRVTASLFASSPGFSVVTQVIFDPTQPEPRTIFLDSDGLLTTSFGTKWLAEHTDYGTIMNNFIYVFDLADSSGLLRAPAHKHDASTLERLIGFHPIDEYPCPISFRQKENQSLTEILAYSALLKERGERIENAISWTYNEYIKSEFGISGFSINLPAEEATWLDKCKSIGPEIERVLKSYQIYVERGQIEEDYFPYIDIKDFDAIPSLLENKYVIGGPEFEKHGHVLFSDQSCLAFSENHPDGPQEFFSMISETHVVESDFHEIYRPEIKKLIDADLVSKEDDGRIVPNRKTVILYHVWHNGALPTYRLAEQTKIATSELVQSNLLQHYGNSLFTPDEADYLNFMFNNAKFCNSEGLRNRYSHASGVISDPNASSIKEDYYRLLLLLIAITLKINDDLIASTGNGGLTNIY